MSIFNPVKNTESRAKAKAELEPKSSVHLKKLSPLRKLRNKKIIPKI